MAKAKTTNGNGRITHEARIAAAWRMSDQSWPPSLGDKVKLFTPKDMRGKSAKVIAIGDEMTKTSTRKAPKDKARVTLRFNNESMQFAVGQQEVFPNEYKLKDLDTIM